jgi:hypothetical protein
MLADMITMFQSLRKVNESSFHGTSDNFRDDYHFAGFVSVVCRQWTKGHTVKGKSDGKWWQLKLMTFGPCSTSANLQHPPIPIDTALFHSAVFRNHGVRDE